MNDDLTDLISNKLIYPRPNTYTYTKALAESLVFQEMKDFPCAIIRPSIIGSTWREPFSGWIDNFNGPSALFPAIGTGLLRTMFGNYESIADLVPVDIVVNCMITSAWYTISEQPKKILVYHCTSGQINKFTWGMFRTYAINTFNKYPFENIVLLPYPHFTSYRYLT